MVLVALVSVAGCLAAPDAALSPASSPDLRLPDDLEIAGAELLERNETFASFLWRTRAPLGAEAVFVRGEPVELAFDLPAGLPLALFAGARDPAPVSAFVLEIVDPDGERRCRVERLASCTALVPTDARADGWRILLHAWTQIDPSAVAEVEIRLRLDPLVDEVARAGRGVACGELACWLPTGFSTWEPTLGITVTGAIFVAAHVPDGAVPQLLARSTDRGATWAPIEAGALGRNLHATSQDPYVHVDPTTGRVFFDNLVGKCSLISWSDDDGVTWSHTKGGCAEMDRQTLFAGPPVTSPTLDYPNVVYRCALNAGATGTRSLASTCSKSLDGGRTWLSTGAPSFLPDPSMTGNEGVPGFCGGGHGHGVVDARGVVYLPKGHCGQPMLSISGDEGATWRVVQVADNGMPRGTATDGPYDGRHEYSADVAVDAEGTVHYAWIAADRLPYLARSLDGGRTWSQPVPLAPEGVVEATLGALAVDASGRIAYAFVGSRNSPGAPWTGSYDAVTWDAYVTVGRGAFTTERVNPAFDPIVRGDCGIVRCAIGDFIDAQFGPDGTGWAVFGDACIEACAFFEDAREEKLNSARMVVARIAAEPAAAGKAEGMP